MGPDYRDFVFKNMRKIDKKARCAVLGYGSWATALVKILTENEQKVGWYIRRPKVIEHLAATGRNPRYLQGVKFDLDRLEVSDDINHIVEQYDIIILATPSAFLQNMLEPLTASFDNKFVVSAIKGIIPNDYLTVGEYLNQKYDLSFGRMGIITGPCHSEEVALERLSYLTLVCKELDNAKVLCDKFTTRYINANPSTDIYGAEYAAVLKNIYAIGAGMAIGLGYGDNFLAVFISNATIEMNRFLDESYPFERLASIPAYLGDLLVTCYSQFSRNRSFGVMVGKGYSISTAQREMNMVAEGYYASECIKQVNKRFNIEMPIANCVYDVLYEGKDPAEAMRKMSDKLY